MITIRLSRGGKKKKPVYTIVAADRRSPRDGRFLEKLGQYNPHADAPMNSIKTERIAQWVKDGAKLSDSVNSLFKKYNVSINK